MEESGVEKKKEAKDWLAEGEAMNWVATVEEVTKWVAAAAEETDWEEEDLDLEIVDWVAVDRAVEGLARAVKMAEGGTGR